MKFQDDPMKAPSRHFAVEIRRRRRMAPERRSETATTKIRALDLTRTLHLRAAGRTDEGLQHMAAWQREPPADAGRSVD